MIKELKYIFYLLTIFFFVFFVTRYYFSDSYEKKAFRSLNFIDEKINIFSKDLIILKNDTADIISYIDNEDNKEEKQYHFWNLLK